MVMARADDARLTRDELMGLCAMIYVAVWHNYMLDDERPVETLGTLWVKDEFWAAVTDADEEILDGIGFDRLTLRNKTPVRMRGLKSV